MNKTHDDSLPAGSKTTEEERTAVHDEVGKLFNELKERHPNAQLTLQVATSDKDGIGFDVLTLYTHGRNLPMFLQAMGDTAMTILGPQAAMPDRIKQH